ncbi:MAG: hypothetical protein PHF26_00220 [Candidatus Gracilibacteria bacterium]|nr:hypothetical protein [Candidatus Gracilibacteria bacterium]
MKSIIKHILFLLTIILINNFACAKDFLGDINVTDYLDKNTINTESDIFFNNFIKAKVINDIGKESKVVGFKCSKNRSGCGFYLKKSKKNIYNKYKNENGIVKLSFSGEKSIQFNYIFNKNQLFKNKMDISDKFFKKSIQKYSLSCEIATTSDIISTLKNTNVFEDSLISIMPKSYFNITSYENGVWGNPNIGFVGYINIVNGNMSKQSEYSGYGIYEAPLAEIYKKYGYNSQIINIYNHSNDYTKYDHLRDLLLEISDRNYVQIWGDYCTNPIKEDGKMKNITQYQANKGINAENYCEKWNLKRDLYWYVNKTNGEKVLFRGLNGEHAFILLGYVGNIEKPDKIIVWDPKTGKHIYPLDEFFRKWDLVENRSIIVYGN